MDFELTEEQRAFQAVARSFAFQADVPHRRKAARVRCRENGVSELSL